MKPISGVAYSSPNKFTFKQDLSLAVFPPVVAWTLRGIMATCKMEIRHSEYYREFTGRHQNHILAFWHETMHLAIYHYQDTGYHTLTSYSFDGEMAARVVRQFGCGAVRGSSSRGGSEALHGLERVIQEVTVGITLDGPRGPHRVAKPGAAILAARAQVPILPIAFAVHPCWRLHSWDHLPVPKPFAKLILAYGPPIPPPVDLATEVIEETRARVERELNALHGEIEGEIGGHSIVG